VGVTRREFLGAGVGAAVAGGLGLSVPRFSFGQSTIDRRATVSRHNPKVNKPDPYAALTVGNGSFAFTADVTGLQTFIDDYKTDFPICTAAHWGWHTTPLPVGLNVADFRYKDFTVYGRKVGYATDSTGQKALFDWMRENPHRLHLGRIGLQITKSDGSPARLADIANIQQELDLWSGVIDSRFEVEGRPVRVRTAAHPDQDLLGVSVDSPLLASGQLSVLIAFPYGTSDLDMADWNSPDRHQTTLTPGRNRADFHRKLDDDAYEATVAWNDASLRQRAAHEFVLSKAGAGPLEFVCRFSPKPDATELPDQAQTWAASNMAWEKFWSTGGCIDLSNSSDARSGELERRIVLSQYNTALHCSGPMPPAETGLLSNSWYGKFHLEMHWWHSAHFAVWNRFPLLNRSLDFYHRVIQVARDTAARQGYLGCRWSKMVGPDGRDSPSPVGPLLIWQQPHPIYYAELAYQQDPTAATLNKWRDVVFESADFMASYAVLDDKTGRYNLGPPMKTVSENADTNTTLNPTFELAYWRFGLRTAQAWRSRLGMSPEPKWSDVQSRLAPAATQDGLYLMQQGMTDTYTKWNWEHPALLGAFGMQAGDGMDQATMQRTIRRVMEVWDWDRAWGWDFPMGAMCAARSGEPELAIKALMIESPKNRYHPNGHVYQRPNLTAYLPANGGLLSAVAMMAAGWTGGPKTAVPGFPADGKWSVHFDKLRTWM
jgi:hypothetical protein